MEKKLIFNKFPANFNKIFYLFKFIRLRKLIRFISISFSLLSTLLF
jgi:hypothetical protein